MTYTESNNTATDTFVNAAGCDSIVTLNLVVNNTFISDQPMDLNIVQSSNAEFNVVTTKTGLTFQWQTDMGTGFQTITNAGQYSGTQTATLTVSSVTTTNDNQKFRCIVSDGDCIDTSEIATLTIGKADVPERSLTKDFTVYPNPTKDVVFISTKASFTGTSYTVYSSSGALIRNGSITSEITTLDIQDLQEGIYFIQLGDNIQQSFKFIKQ